MCFGASMVYNGASILDIVKTQENYVFELEKCIKLLSNLSHCWITNYMCDSNLSDLSHCEGLTSSTKFSLFIT